MNAIDRIYLYEILRAVYGPFANTAKVHDIERLNKIAGRLADSELAQTALQAKGYGRGGVAFLELTRDVPVYTLGMAKNLFAPRTPVCYPTAARKP